MHRHTQWCLFWLWWWGESGSVGKHQTSTGPSASLQQCQKKYELRSKEWRKLTKNFFITQCSSLVAFIKLGTFLILRPRTANSGSNLRCETSGRLRSAEGWEPRHRRCGVRFRLCQNWRCRFIVIAHRRWVQGFRLRGRKSVCTSLPFGWLLDLLRLSFCWHLPQVS